MTRLVTLLGYAVLLAAALGLEVDARRRAGSGTAGDALAALRHAWPTRLLLLAAWLWLGWHLFARVDWR